MKQKPYGVQVVVDPNFGERLRHIPAGVPVWIVDSEANHPVIHAIWRQTDQKDHRMGITSFRADPNENPDDWLISELGVIDTHFGDESCHPPYSFLNVIGAQWSEKIQRELDCFGFTEHEATAEGFRATKGLTND